MIDPRDCTPPSFEHRARAYNVGPEIVRRLLSAIVARGIHDPARWSRLQIPHRLIGAVGPLPRLHREASLVSPRDGFQKLRFRTGDGLAIETVIIPLKKPGAVSLCLSSQVGCVMACQFCATARMQERRNLRSWEIIDQFIQARDLAR
ncbi:MAG: radical SAM protein, partial [Isosphaeraceae bacterium]